MTVIFLKAGTTSWAVPSDWPGTGVVECFGPGGNGYQDRAGAGGGGGAYAKLNALAATAGASIACQVGAGGSQQNTWLGSTTTVLAAAGTKGTSTSSSTPGFGGTAANSVGDVKFSGGDGGPGGTYGGGGGGAAGPSGAGTIGTNPNGGASNNGATAGGLGATTATAVGAPGAAAEVYTQTSNGEKAGPGSGGGGSRGSNGGAGGTYGGGGGAGNSAAAGGTGGDGLIVITYTPTASTGKTFLVGALALGQRYAGATKASRYVGTSLEWAAVEPWKWERAVTLNNASGSALTGYQHLVVLTESNFDFTTARDDGADLRVTDTDKSTLLPFWVEAWDKTAKTARIWVKCDAPAGANKTVYLYSGKSDAAAKSNIDTTMEFGDDFTGSKTVFWNRYAVVNPVLSITGSEAIVGDPMIIPPDSANNEWGIVYFSSSGESRYAKMTADGKGLTRVGAFLTPADYGYDKVIKPHMIWWAPDNCYYAVAQGMKSGQNPVLLLFKGGTSRSTGFALVKVLLTPDGTDTEGPNLDCPFFLFDGTKLRLYYSAHTIGNLEPKNFCVAFFDAGPTSTLTRYAGNPILGPQTQTTWANIGLGGMSVRKLTSGTYAGWYEIFFNAFTENEVSQMGSILSPDGLNLVVKESDKLLPISPSAISSDFKRLYRPGQFNFTDPGAQADRMFYNALGDKENILYAEKAPTLDYGKWVAALQGQARLNFPNGVMKMTEGRTSGDHYFNLCSSYSPPINTVLEARARVDQLFMTNPYAAPIMLTDGKLPNPSGTTNLHLFLIAKNSGQVRHQSRDGGSWRSEDTVTTTYPPIGEFLRYKQTIKSAAMDYEVLNDAGTSLGKLANNTDAPQGSTGLLLAIGAQGMEVSYDFIFARKYVDAPPSVSVGAAAAVSKAGL